FLLANRASICWATKSLKIRGTTLPLDVENDAFGLEGSVRVIKRSLSEGDKPPTSAEMSRERDEKIEEKQHELPKCSSTNGSGTDVVPTLCRLNSAREEKCSAAVLDENEKLLDQSLSKKVTHGPGATAGPAFDTGHLESPRVQSGKIDGKQGVGKREGYV